MISSHLNLHETEEEMKMREPERRKILPRVAERNGRQYHASFDNQLSKFGEWNTIQRFFNTERKFNFFLGHFLR